MSRIKVNLLTNEQANAQKTPETSLYKKSPNTQWHKPCGEGEAAVEP